MQWFKEGSEHKMAHPIQGPEIIRVAQLSQHKPHGFDLAPDAAALEEMARDLGLSALRKLRFRGTLRADGRRDWLLQAELGATVTQPCVVTLAPVTTRIDETVTRRFSPDHDLAAQEPGAETEMPEDDTLEPLEDNIDLRRVMTEALALALPDWPRDAGAELGRISVTEEGIAPMRDEEVKPFAALGALRDKLQNKE